MMVTVLGACLALSESRKPRAGTGIFLIFRRGGRSSEKVNALRPMAQLRRASLGLEPRVDAEGQALVTAASLEEAKHLGARSGLFQPL